MTLSIALVALLGAQAPAAPVDPAAPVSPPSGQAPAPLEQRTVERLSLTALFADPLPRLGSTVRAVVQVESVPERWNPYVTRFGPGEWIALRVWGDEQYLWVERDWHRPVGLVFARKGSAAAELFASAARFDRIEVTLEVREVLLGRPWTEATLASALPERVGEGTVLHASRALRLLAAGEPRLALEELRRAQAPGLPRHARAELRRLRGLCGPTSD